MAIKRQPCFPLWRTKLLRCPFQKVTQCQFKVSNYASDTNRVSCQVIRSGELASIPPLKRQYVPMLASPLHLLPIQQFDIAVSATIFRQESEVQPNLAMHSKSLIRESKPLNELHRQIQSGGAQTSTSSAIPHHHPIPSNEPPFPSSRPIKSAPARGRTTNKEDDEFHPNREWNPQTNEHQPQN